MDHKDWETWQNCFLFRDCPASEVKTMITANAIMYRETEKDAFLLTRDSSEHTLGLLLNGTAIVERKAQDGKMLMSRLRTGDLFGAASLFCDEPEYVVDIRCLTDCRTAWIPEDLLFKWLRSNDIVLRNYLTYLNRRIRFLNKRLDALSNPTVSTRLMSYLQNEAINGAFTIRSYTELSRLLCISRPSLYRALDALCAEGKLLREGKNIIILEEI